MAVYSGTVTYSYSGTTTAGSVDTVNITSPGTYRVRVWNTGGTTGALWYKPNTIGTADPTAGADGAFFVPASAYSDSSVFAGRNPITSVKVYSAAAVTYTVESLGLA